MTRRATKSLAISTSSQPKHPKRFRKNCYELSPNASLSVFDFYPIRDIQVLTPMNRGSLGVREFNVALQHKLSRRDATSDTVRLDLCTR